MAYAIYNGVKELLVDLNGQSTEKFESIISPDIDSYNGGGIKILNNPYISGTVSTEGYTNWSSQDLVLYSMIENLKTGTINLLSLDLLIPVGGYAKIYRKGITNTYIYYVRSSDIFRREIRLYLNGNNIGLDFGVSLGPWPNGIKLSSIGFLYDSNIDKFAMYSTNVINSWNTGYHGNSIMARYGHAENPSQGQILQIQQALDILLRGNVTYPDPYEDGGYSTSTEQGTGTFDDTSENVPLPTTYALSATASGLMSQYVLTEANLSAFGSWLWNGGTIVDDLKHFFQSPMEAIFSVGILPFTPSDTTPYNVYVGALAATGVQGGLVGDTVEKISCGSITFDGYYGGALDYNPYTKIELFLPYCGTLTLNADEVMGHTISVDYYCDTITGDCVAFVSDEERVLHQVRGNCFIQIPLAARDFTALYSSAIAAIGTIAAGLATAASGGISAPVAVGMGTSMAANAMNAKTHIARAGGVSGMAGFMSIQTPYVIMTIPNQCLPEFQREYQGYPLFVTKRLGDFSGFTKVYEIHLDGLDCTDAEMKEIYELLKGGVIL